MKCNKEEKEEKQCKFFIKQRYKSSLFEYYRGNRLCKNKAKHNGYCTVHHILKMDNMQKTEIQEKTKK